MLPLIEKCAARKIVVLSTTSLFTKVNSKQKDELELVKKIEKAEREFTIGLKPMVLIGWYYGPH